MPRISTPAMQALTVVRAVLEGGCGVEFEEFEMFVLVNGWWLKCSRASGSFRS